MFVAMIRNNEHNKAIKSKLIKQHTEAVMFCVIRSLKRNQIRGRDLIGKTFVSHNLARTCSSGRKTEPLTWCPHSLPSNSSSLAGKCTTGDAYRYDNEGGSLTLWHD